MDGVHALIFKVERHLAIFEPMPQHFLKQLVYLVSSDVRF